MFEFFEQMKKEELEELLKLSQFVSQALKQHENENKKFKEKMLETINFEKNIKNLGRTWWLYQKENYLSKEQEEFIENSLNDLAKNYEKLSCSNFS